MTAISPAAVGRVRSLVWVVARVRLSEENTVALTLEKIRAGAIPVPAEEIDASRLAAARRVRRHQDHALPAVPVGVPSRPSWIFSIRACAS
jgi:hypothetical protein